MARYYNAIKFTESETIFHEVLGAEFKRIREKKGLSQWEVSKKLILHRMTILRLEKGRPTTLLTYMRLAEFYKVALSDLLLTAELDAPAN